MADIESVTSPQVGAQSYVEWGAVVGGAVAALATGLVLLNFGAAIGLASVSPFTSTATGLKAVGIGAAFWFLLVTVWSFALGGYLAGRLRHRWNDATPNEVEFRDSAHGLLVWSPGSPRRSGADDLRANGGKQGIGERSREFDINLRSNHRDC